MMEISGSGSENHPPPSGMVRPRVQPDDADRFHLSTGVSRPVAHKAATPSGRQQQGRQHRPRLQPPGGVAPAPIPQNLQHLEKGRQDQEGQQHGPVGPEQPQQVVEQARPLERPQENQRHDHAGRDAGHVVRRPEKGDAAGCAR